MAEVQKGRFAVCWRRAALLACSALAPWMAGLPARANPEGAQVVAGQVTVGAAGQTVTVNQASARAIVNWNSFSIGAGETTRFVQPSAASAILNRVTGGDPSALMGQLQANGRVYLINPHGVVVGREGRIDTGAFVASTLDLPDTDFLLGGPMTFQGLSGAGIKVLGAIKASDGDVVLVAASVENQGQIVAPNGRAILGAGSSVLYMPAGGGDIVIAAWAPGALVDNGGRIEAAEVQLKAAGGAHALAVNTGGIVTAVAIRDLGGRVVIDGGAGDVAVAGEITARQGDNGGEVRVLSQGTTRFDGLISVGGGDAGGDGGFAEVSGKTLELRGRVDLAAPHGRGGKLLLDPQFLTIDSGNVGTYTSALAGGDVLAQADDQLTVATAISSTSTHTLELRAPDIAINADISLANGRFVASKGSTGVSGPLVLASGAKITANTIYMPGPFTQVDLRGAVTTTEFTVDDNVASSFAATNSANAIDSFTTVGHSSFSGDVAVTSGAAMAVSGQFDVAGNLTLRTVSGNLTLSGLSLDVTGTAKLAATGGTLVNNVGAGLFTGAGRRLIYISTATGFVDGGLGYTQQSGVFYPNDPAGAGNVTYISGPATVVTITANSFSRLYGAANPTFTGSFSGGTSANLATQPQFRIVSGGVNVGSFTIEPYGADGNPGFTPAYVNGVLTITAAPLTVTANSFSRAYGAANPTLTASFSGLVNGDSSSAISGLNLQTAANLNSGVGSYGITLGSLSAGNYTITAVDGTLTVTKAALTITANSFSRLYGAANPTLTATFSGLASGDSAASISGLSLQTTATAASAVGSYAITLGALTSANYTITAVNGALTVNPAPLMVTVNSATRTYGADNPAFTATYAGLANGETQPAGLTFTTSATAASGVGAYAIHPQISSGNYTVTAVDGVLTVTRAPLTVTVASFSRPYGDANPTLTANLAGLVNGDTAAAITGLAVTTTATQASGVGSYAIRASGGSANYALTFVDGVLAVTPAPLIIAAASFSRLYGAANPELTTSITGLKNGESAAVISGLSAQTTATQASGAGDYAITLGAPTAANYAITAVNGVLSVTPAPLTVTAASFSRLYGAANPVFTATYSGLVNGESQLTGLTFVTPATQASGVGTYAIRPQATSANYAVTFVDGALRVTPAPLTITAASFSRLYGAANPTFTASYAGLVNGETEVPGLTLTTVATPTTGVGTYSIRLQASSANYAVTLVDGQLTVNRAPLTVTADSFSRLYGDANPALTARYSGFVNGETAAVLVGLAITTPATQASGAGSYAIRATATAANYALTFVDGVMSVTPAPLTITASNAQITTGAALPDFKATYSGFRNGDTSGILKLAFSTPSGAAAKAGTYAITPSGDLLSGRNYTLAFVNGALSVVDPPPPPQNLTEENPFSAPTNLFINHDPSPGSPLVWLPGTNVNFQPLFGISFWEPLGSDFEACLLGASFQVSPYGSSFVGLGLGC